KRRRRPQTECAKEILWSCSFHPAGCFVFDPLIGARLGCDRPAAPPSPLVGEGRGWGVGGCGNAVPPLTTPPPNPGGGGCAALFRRKPAPLSLPLRRKWRGEAAPRREI